MELNAHDFTTLLREKLSPLVDNERTVYAGFVSAKGFTTRPNQSSIHVKFYNLPEARLKERRGGGAEAENNRVLLHVHGFCDDMNAPVAKVKVELLVNNIGSRDNYAPALRAKTASPDRVAEYIADYINEIAQKYEPNFTHD
jgi:hypothetical protein